MVGPGRVVGPVDAPWSVGYSDSLQPLAPTALYRTIAVVAVDQLDEVIPVVAAQPTLQTVGLATSPKSFTGWPICWVRQASHASAPLVP